MSLATDPVMSRKLAKVYQRREISELGIGWWQGFLKHAERKDSMEDVPKKYRKVIDPLLKDVKGRI